MGLGQLIASIIFTLIGSPLRRKERPLPMLLYVLQQLKLPEKKVAIVNLETAQQPQLECQKSMNFKFHKPSLPYVLLLIPQKKLYIYIYIVASSLLHSPLYCIVIHSLLFEAASK